MSVSARQTQRRRRPCVADPWRVCVFRICVGAFRSIVLLRASPHTVCALRLHLYAHRPTWRDIFKWLGRSNGPERGCLSSPGLCYVARCLPFSTCHSRECSGKITHQGDTPSSPLQLIPLEQQRNSSLSRSPPRHPPTHPWLNWPPGFAHVFLKRDGVASIGLPP
jgi:hypothetical protein